MEEPIYIDGKPYVPYRTCHGVIETDSFGRKSEHCSECGAEWLTWVSFCQKCGAKVER